MTVGYLRLLLDQYSDSREIVFRNTVDYVKGLEMRIDWVGLNDETGKVEIS